MPSQHFLKGNAGKPKGAKNIVSRQMKELMLAYTSDNFEIFKESMEKLAKSHPSKFIEFYIRLLEFQLPKASVVRMEIEENSAPRTWNIQIVGSSDSPISSSGDKTDGNNVKVGE